jgi:hypothetical protein
MVATVPHRIRWCLILSWRRCLPDCAPGGAAAKLDRATRLARLGEQQPAPQQRRPGLLAHDAVNRQVLVLWRPRTAASVLGPPSTLLCCIPAENRRLQERIGSETWPVCLVVACNIAEVDRDQKLAVRWPASSGYRRAGSSRRAPRCRYIRPPCHSTLPSRSQWRLTIQQYAG